METGLSGHPLTPQLPTGKPGPLYHLLERLRDMGPEPSVRKLKCLLDSLEFTERYFAGVAGGLLRKLEDPPNLTPLAQNAVAGNGLRRLLRFCLNRLEVHAKTPSVIDLFSCFYLHGKRNLPYSHTRWMGLVPGSDYADSNPNWNYDEVLEKLSAPAAFEAMDTEIRNLSELLQSIIEGGSAFFETHDHFARLDERGWQCTLKKGEVFTELIPAIPTRLIPLEAQAPTSAPQTEDEHLLSSNPFLPERMASNHAAAGNHVSPEPLELAEEAVDVAEVEVEVEVATEDDLMVEEAQIPESVATAQESDEAGPSEDFQAMAQESRRTPSLDLDSSPEVKPTEEQADAAPFQDRSESDDALESWSAGELKSFKASLQQVYPRFDLDRIPQEYLNKLNRFLSSVSSGYILVEGEQGSGKTLLTQAFRDSLQESSLELTPLLFSVKNQFYPDTATFLEQLNESLRIRPGAGRKSFEALDPAVIKDLNMRSPGDARAGRFVSFLSELKLVNGTNLVLLLDGLDEGSAQTAQFDSLFTYLPAHLPDGVFVLLSYHPERVRPEEREILELIHSGPSIKISLVPEDSLYLDFVERFLSWGGHGPLPEGLAETLIEKSGGRLATAQHFLDGLRCELLEGKNDLHPAE